MLSGEGDTEVQEDNVFWENVTEVEVENVAVC